MKPHIINLENWEIEEITKGRMKTLATIRPAKEEDVKTVLNAPIDTGDGRSQWVWVRLLNGDLILGVFPQGDTYLAMEGSAP